MPRLWPETPGRAFVFGATIALVLECAHLALTLLFVDVPSVGWLLERGNYRINVVISVLTGFTVAAITYGHGAELRDLEPRRRELGWSEERLGALLAQLAPRLGPAIVCGLALAPVGAFLVTGSDTSRPFPLTDDPWTVSVAWATATNLLLFATVGAMAYCTFAWRRVDQALDAEPSTLDLLDPSADRRIAASGLRRSFFWIGGSSLASLVFVDLQFSWMTGLVVIATLAVGAILFLTPLLELARRIRTTKDRELLRVRDRIRAARDALLSGAPGGRGLATELPALLAYEKRIEEVRPFALDAFQVVRFAGLVVLAVGSWLGGAMADRLVDRFLR